MIRLLPALLLAFHILAAPLQAHAQPQGLQAVLQAHHDLVEDASRRTVQAVLDALAESRADGVAAFLERWQGREVYMRDSDGMFFFVEGEGDDPLTLIDIETGEAAGTAGPREMSQLRPNGGVRRVIGGALVQFQLIAPNRETRALALEGIERRPVAEHLPLLAQMLETETDPELRAAAEWQQTRLTIAYSNDPAERVTAIQSLTGDLRIEARAALNPLLSNSRAVAASLPEGINLARTLEPGSTALSVDEAYAMLVEAGLAPAEVTAEMRRDALIAHVTGNEVAGVRVHTLRTEEARRAAYDILAAQGLVPMVPTEADRLAAVQAHVFHEVYDEPSQVVTSAALETLASINTRVGLLEMVDLSLDGVSLVSIYFLAAIGLAITFGVMGVINMAHGEFIMMGAYTGYVVQTVIPDYTVSILVALPLAFVLTFGAGVAMERLVIRWLYARPLETLLATFGISIALQQITRQVFGAQARPFTAPDWLAGSLVFNDVVAISYIRIAIFGLGVLIFALLWLILNRTRLGLEVRAVTQDPSTASSMGINPDRINMLTFGLGSGIAGIAGVAIGLFAQVTPELGTHYIVQSFMTVVVGGVGNIFGTLAGASLIGFLQKGIEWLNPSNTLVAQTYMILFVILFIQFRPRGIIALKGRAAGA